MHHYHCVIYTYIIIFILSHIHKHVYFHIYIHIYIYQFQALQLTVLAAFGAVDCPLHVDPFFEKHLLSLFLILCMHIFAYISITLIIIIPCFLFALFSRVKCFCKVLFAIVLFAIVLFAIVLTLSIIYMISLSRTWILEYTDRILIHKENTISQ